MPAPLWLLVLVTFSGTLAMHMFVPALPAAACDLHTSAAKIQLSITLYVLGLAVGQLAYGPLSDQYGRRPMLLAGLLLYTAAGLVCMLAPTATWLIAARFVQAFGGCAGLLLARAIVRDTASPGDTVRRLAFLGLVTLIGPGLAPLPGGIVSAALGWRFIFVLFSALGLVGLGLSWLLLQETRQKVESANAATLRAGYWRLLKTPAFIGRVIGGGCATTSFYAFIAGAPFVFVEQLHQTPQVAGLCLGFLIAGISAGNFVASRMVRRVSLEYLMVGANAISVACAVVLLAQVLLTGPHLVTLEGLMVVYCVGVGICSPAVATMAMSVDPELTGSAAGLYGFMQMATGALCTLLAGIGSDHALTAVAVMVGAGLFGQMGCWLARRSGRSVAKSLGAAAPLEG